MSRFALLFSLLTWACGEGPPPEGESSENQPWLDTVTARIVAEDRAVQLDDSGFFAQVGGQRLRFEGRTLSRAGGFRATTRAFGRTDQHSPVQSARGEWGACTELFDTMGDCIRRLEFEDGPLTEWWRGTERGLQQGWRLQEAPQGQGPVWIEVALEGVRGLSTGPQRVAWTDAGGQRWFAREARAWDAAGRPLPAHFEPKAGFAGEPSGFRLIVDDSGAQYPIEVDPLYSSESWSVEGVAESGEFGTSVAVLGDVNGDGYDDVAVGGPEYGASRGRAYVFFGSSSGLSANAAVRLHGGADGDRLGASVAAAGDLNGDGRPDLAVGAPGASSDAGEVRIFLSSTLGITEDVSTVLSGTAAGDEFGAALAGLGDTDGDGFGDLAVGAPGAGSDAGEVSVFAGLATGVSSSASVVIAGSTAQGRMGESVGSSGDVNGDGYADLVIGAPGLNATIVPAVFLHYGSASGIVSTGSTTWTAGAGTYLGCSVSGAGDVNADGFGDVIVGAWGASSTSGRAYLHLGSAGGLSSSASTTLSAPTTLIRFGSAVSRAGDVNGDGYDDVIVGAPAYSSSKGRAYVYKGSASGLGTSVATTITGAANADQLGSALAGGGDINGDGKADIVVGSLGYSAWGAIQVHHGLAPAPSATANTLVEGVTSTQYLGISVAAAGDVNADGFEDLLVGANGANRNAGAVYFFLGSASGPSTVASQTFVGNSSSEGLGGAVAGLGDVNGDGFADVAFGAPGYSTATGRVYVHQGSAAGIASSPARTLTGASTGANFGYAVAGAGDVNGDGYDDLLVGAYGTSSSAGRASIYPGSAFGVVAVPSATINGSSGANLGIAVDGAGDVNGDGFDDVVIGASRVSSSAGRAYVHHGSSSGLSTTPALTLSGPSSSVFGTAVAGLGDVNGDGYADIAVGAPQASSSTGLVQVHVGSSSGVNATPMISLTGSGPSEGFGRSVDFLDVNADGYDDLLVGAYTFGVGGAAMLYTGSASGLSSTATSTWSGGVDELFGKTVAGADINGDGLDDVVVGAYGYEEGAGRAVAYLAYGDADGDGVGLADDCDDADPAVGAGTSAFVDADGDGWGSAIPTVACPGDTFVASVDGDCDDGAATVFPGATELCDGSDVDEDCDGFAEDADVDSSGKGSYHPDNDGDGFGDGSVVVSYCDAPSGVVADGTDCDDSAISVYPGAPEWCDGLNIDEDCDGLAEDLDADSTGKASYHPDSDGDGFGLATVVYAYCDPPMGLVSDGTDCDDGAASVYPGASEYCDALDVDEDCDGLAEDADADSSGKATYHPDGDGDGFGDGAVAVVYCDAPSGVVTDGTDCDDGVFSVYPGAPELCDSLDTDEDCDGLAEDFDADSSGKGSYHPDSDGDGFGNAAVTLSYCDAPSGVVTDATDCDDSALSVYPGAPELCDSLDVDEDCDGLAEDADADSTGKGTYHPDSDGDGYGDGMVASPYCDPPSGVVSDGTDCDDGVRSVYPGAPELCDSLNVDEDCDGLAEDADAESTGKGSFHPDSDGDGFGNGSVLLAYCDAPSGVVTDGTDCDDGAVSIYPGAAEFCDGLDVDEDCDGLAEDADADSSGKGAYHPDGDGDGFGDGAVVLSYCDAPSGVVSDGTDCDDSALSVYPGAPEVCDSLNVDEDCDGLAEDADIDSSGKGTYHPDGDGDGFGDGTLALPYCDAPSGVVSDGTDCDDSLLVAYPGAPETDCTDPRDLNCDGSVGYADADSDGFAACEDCDDGDAAISPDGVEMCDALDRDEDCDGLSEDADPGVVGKTEYYADADGDLYGDPAITASYCDAPSGWVDQADDCEDGDADAFPGAPELDCTDPRDLNCDGSTGYADLDADGWAACEDCDDEDERRRPDAEEGVGDGVDQNCDGVDLCFADEDGDGHGDGSTLETTDLACEGVGVLGAGSALDDCDDANAERAPGREDVIGDGVDQDCDGSDSVSEDSGGPDSGADGADGSDGVDGGGVDSGGADGGVAQGKPQQGKQDGCGSGSAGAMALLVLTVGRATGAYSRRKRGAGGDETGVSGENHTSKL